MSQEDNTLLVPVVVPVVVFAFVPVMVVAELASIAIPVACMVFMPIVMGLHPTGGAVWGTGPISVVPLIVVAHGVPVSR
jgi:hypothetical protein